MATAVPASVQTTPAVKNFGSMKQDVANYVQMGDAPTELGIAGDAINSAISELNAFNWSWNLVYTDITFAASTGDYTIPANFRKPRKFIVMDSAGSEKTILAWEDPKTFMDYYKADNTDGTPHSYTVFNSVEYQTLSLNVPASSSWVASNPTGRLWYFRRLARLESDSDVLVAPHEVEAWLKWQARWEVAAVYDDAGASKIDRAAMKASMLWRNIRRTETDTQSDFL